MLVVANLSRFAQTVTLDLHEHRGAVPVELFGGNEFAPIVEGGYNLTLGAYGFYWFSLQPQHHDARGVRSRARGPARWSPPPTTGDSCSRPGVAVAAHWPGPGRRSSPATAGTPGGPTRIRSHRDPRCRAGGRRAGQAGRLHHAGPGRVLRRRTRDLRGPHHRRHRRRRRAGAGRPPQRGGGLGRGAQPGRSGRCCSTPPPTTRSWRRRCGPSGATVASTRWPAPSCAPRRSPELRRMLTEADDLTVSHPSVEQSNTSAVFGHQVVMKIFRRAQEGVNPDLEIGRRLSEVGFEHAARLLGALEYQRGRGRAAHAGRAQRLRAQRGRRLALHPRRAGPVLRVGRWASCPTTRSTSPPGPRSPSWSAFEPPDATADAIGPYLDLAEVLGRRTAELHQALADSRHGEDFRPEPFTTLYQRSVYQSMRAQVRPTLAMVRRLVQPARRRRAGRWPTWWPSSRGRLLERFGAIRQHRIDVSRIRIHGDYHLGQVLHAGRDFVIIDFEGEPSRSPTERRIKRGAPGRRRRHRPLVPVRGRGRPCAATPSATACPPGAAGLAGRAQPGLAGVGHRPLPDRLPRRGRRASRSCPPTPRTATPCSPPTCWTRPSTRCATT